MKFNFKISEISMTNDLDVVQERQATMQTRRWMLSLFPYLDDLTHLPVISSFEISSDKTP